MAPRTSATTVTPRGRPATGVLRTQVRLHPDDIERAKLLGNGNVSAGIRAALKTAVSVRAKGNYPLTTSTDGYTVAPNDKCCHEIPVQRLQSRIPR